MTLPLWRGYLVYGAQVDGLPVEDYLKRFEWNEARFSPRMNLREIVDKIVEEMTRLEDDLKLQMTEVRPVSCSSFARTPVSGLPLLCCSNGPYETIL